MRVSMSALSFAAVAAAIDLPNYPPDGNVALTVGAGSSLEGYKLAGFLSEGKGFPELVPATEAKPDTWYLHFWNLVHTGWYAITMNIDGTTYQLERNPNDFELTPQTEYSSGDDLWQPRLDSPVFPWWGSETAFPFGCTRDDGHIQLSIHEADDVPANCEQIQLEYHLLA
ncbi:hypothetical protein F5B22DRAFT_641678 [Xylaria bambusicola]|uniref:uncharacterized protein n=1 Tax=Xylaria bambusicola TaxID=326684 RepID=UPI002007E46D|nr:uncharacterized protein F5B22DRAFT_641678 [Xylaria bambusicola]KAI0526533.1 hypothetical protein F5B22DRAFT_641678 [Xylaria bambusicola]